MADLSDKMPKVDLDKDLSSVQKLQLDYMRRIQKENAERVAKLKKIRNRNLITGSLLTASVLGISLGVDAYSILAVKQENFLDELDDTQATK